MKAVNLIPSGERAGAANLAGSSEGGAFIVLGLMAALAVLALLYGVAHHQVSSRTGQAATLAAEATEAQAQASRLAPYTSFVAMRNQRQEAITQLIESRFDWAHAFHELGRVLPYDVSLISVHGSTGSGTTSGSSSTTTTTTTSTSTSSSAAAPAATPGATTASAGITSATPAGTTPTFTLVGCATSQSEVAQTLDRLRLIDGVADVELQSSTKSESGGSSSSSSGTCPSPNYPTFTVNVTFSPLPAPTAAHTALSAPGTETTSTVTTQTTTGANGGS